MAAIGCPVDFVCAIDDDEFRKPRRGMWDALLRLRGIESVDLEGSVYVGDAAGRPSRGKRRKDFAASDLLLAANIGCAFRTPESFFLGSTEDIDNRFETWGYLCLADLVPTPLLHVPLTFTSLGPKSTRICSPTLATADRRWWFSSHRRPPGRARSRGGCSATSGSTRTASAPSKRVSKPPEGLFGRAAASWWTTRI